MKKTLTLFFTGVFILQTSAVLAWGVTGHRVVGEIADKHITDKTKKAIKRVLGNSSMAVESNWMDDIKSDHQTKYDTLNAYHYVSIPDGMKYEETNLNPKGDAIRGMQTAISKLKSGQLSSEMEAHYLKMLIHIVGDLHQPLHVGRPDDAGGNAIKVSWFGESSNLHKVWDSDIINGKLYSYTELTNIINHPTPEEIKKWQDATLDDWIKEAQDLRLGIYDFEEKRYWEYEYMYAHWDTIQNQLLKAGVRLAGILNDIYG